MCAVRPVLCVARALRFATSGGDKDKVFSRIASSFVALHNEVPTGYRDIFFNTQSYPYLVTQSVYV